MAGRIMEGTNTGKREMLDPVITHMGKENEKIYYYYEDVRELVKKIDEGFIDGFDKLFPSPSAIEEYPFMRYFARADQIFKYYKETQDLNCLGAMICTILRLHKEDAPTYVPDSDSDSSSDREMPIVYFPSIETLITNDPSLLAEKSNTEEKILSEGFDKAYIDPHGYVEKIATRLKEYMNLYTRSSNYVAPCTSLVTSSMMGKSRLMKELASRVPIVYMCVRGEKAKGFPTATTGILDWFTTGVCKELGIELTDPEIASDNDDMIATLRHSLFLLNVLKHLRDLIEDVSQPTPTRYPSLAGHINVRRSSFEWMWDFFVDYTQPYAIARRLFWDTVKAQTHVDIVRLWGSGGNATSDWAMDYLKGTYKGDIRQADRSLRESLRKLCPTIKPNTFNTLPFIICFDEASHLCTTSAVTGERINTGDAESIANPELPNGFSNFRAMRRALRYLRVLKAPIPLVFGLFTDTTSRLTNFQPRRGDERSIRVPDLPFPGRNQFAPIHVFTSIDAHAMVEAGYCAKSDPTKVAKAETLLKFGRAGWYSCYSRDSQLFNMENLLTLAMVKLVGGGEPIIDLSQALDSKESWPFETRIRLLAVIACRLALAVGPFSTEARDLVSSHLAILLDTDPDRHFLKIYYPSEPILAEVSAEITSDIRIGWLPAVRALYQHLQNGIVSAGYRGELLSKVLCLIAMDRIEKPFSNDPTYWTHTQPVKTRAFLDGWLTPPAGYQTFTDALLDAKTSVNKTELERFLDGHVFFTHFIRVDRIVSVPAMAHAWNRGAAIMCKECTHSFDHVIPVMLPPTNGAPPEFGPMYGHWDRGEDRNQLKRACSNVSGIFINSKCYTALDGYDCTPNEQNFEDFEMFGGKNVKSVFLSIGQGFGPRQEREPYVNIRPRGNRTVHRIYRQIVVILKELGPKTYACLQPESYSNDDFSSEEESDVEDDLDRRMDVEEEESMNEEDEVEDEVPDPAFPDDDGEEDEVELPDYGSVLDDDEELGDDEMAGVTKYLRMLRTTNFGFLDDVDKEDIPGVKDFLPLVYAGERGEEAERAEEEWDEERKKYWPLQRGCAGDCS